MKSFVLPVLLFTFIMSVCSSSIDPNVPWDCPENEVYFKCALEQCYNDCKDLQVIKPCPSIAAGCYQPACLCKEGMLRNAAGVCVPTSECEQKSP